MEVQSCQPKIVKVTNLDSPDKILHRNGFGLRKEIGGVEDIDESEDQLFLVLEPTCEIVNKCNNLITESMPEVGTTESINQLVSSVTIPNNVLRQNGNISDTTNHVSNKVIVFDPSDVEESVNEMDLFVEDSNALIDHEVAINDFDNDIVLTENDDMFLYYEEIEKNNGFFNGENHAEEMKKVEEVDQVEVIDLTEEGDQVEEVDQVEVIDQMDETILQPTCGTTEAFTQLVYTVTIPNIVFQQNGTIIFTRRDTSNSIKLPDLDNPGRSWNENNGSTHHLNHTEEKPYQCDICEKRFALYNSWKRHERIHTGEKPYICGICEKSFTQSSSLKQHERIHTGEKPYSCDVCEKSFTQYGGLKNHETIHTGEKPYQCDVCEKTFARSSDLRIHYRTHTGEKPYKCDVCKKRYTNSSHWRVHYRIHTGEKPYKCDVCEKRFAHSSSFKDHERIHTGEKPYGCGVCKKSFTQSSTLRQHERIHTGKKPYKCDVCEKTFTRSYALKSHGKCCNREQSYTYKCGVCEKVLGGSWDLKNHERLHMAEMPYKYLYCTRWFPQSHVPACDNPYYGKTL